MKLLKILDDVLDIVTEFLIRDRNDHGIPLPAFLPSDNPLKNNG